MADSHNLRFIVPPIEMGQMFEVAYTAVPDEHGRLWRRTTDRRSGAATFEWIDCGGLDFDEIDAWKPWEQSFMPARHYNWQPLPTLYSVLVPMADECSAAEALVELGRWHADGYHGARIVNELGHTVPTEVLEATFGQKG